MGAWADAVWVDGSWQLTPPSWVGITGSGSGGTVIPTPSTDVRLDSCSIVHTIHTDDAVFTTNSEVNSMEVSNVQTPGRDDVWRSSATGTVTLDFTFSDDRARGFGFWGIFNHLLHGASVRFQLFSDLAATLQVYDSTSLAVGTSVNLGQRFGQIQGTLRDQDLLFHTQPVWRFFLPMVYAKAGRLTITGTPLDENDIPLAYYQIGRFAAGPFWQFDRGVDFAPALSHPSNTARSRSGGGSNRRRRGATWKKLACNMRVTSHDDLIALESIMAWMADGRDGVLSLHTGRFGFVGGNYLLNGCFTTEDAIIKDFSIAGRQLVFESN